MAAGVLAKGRCTGARLLQTPGGLCKLQVRWGPRGRGLYAARPLKKGEIIATIGGYLASEAERGRECWQWTRNQVFVMEHPSLEHLGSLANTAAGTCSNNARYSCDRNCPYEMQLRAIRHIAKGEEILAAYGRGYVAVVKKRIASMKEDSDAREAHVAQVAPVKIRGGAAPAMICAKCGRRVKSATRLAHARFCQGLR
jgi:hypothetical protein